MKRSMDHLLDFEMMGKSSLLMPTGYFQGLVSALNLSDPGSALQAELCKVLGVSKVSGKTIRDINEELRNLKVESNTVLYQNEVLKETEAINFFQEGGIEIVKNDAELNEALKETTLNGTKIQLDVKKGTQVLLNSMSFQHSWFHVFYRIIQGNFRTSREKIQRAMYISTKDYLKAVRRDSKFMAVQLKLAKRKMTMDELTYFRLNYEKKGYLDEIKNFPGSENNDNEFPDEKIEDMVRNVQFDNLEVYLVGQWNQTTPVPKMTKPFYDEVINSFTNLNEHDALVTIPIFNVTGESTLPSNKLFKNLLLPLNTDFSQLNHQTEFIIKQEGFLCVDEKGIQGESRSFKLLVSQVLPEIYRFDTPFYFMLVHKATKIPVAISYVDSVLESMTGCSSV